MSSYTLRVTQTQHELLKTHLFPGDGLEAVAIGLCGRRRGAQVHALTLRKVVPIPYDECSVRAGDRVTWSTRLLVPLLAEAEKRDLAVIKIHCHPGGYYDLFSEIDDASDADLFNSVSSLTDSAYPHCSAVMLPDGKMFGRVIFPDGNFRPLNSILIAGDDINFWTQKAENIELPGYTLRHAQMFGSGTTQQLQRLSVAVVGCSGTGSPVIEQLARLGVGRLVLVDPDGVEEKNLNRIINATRDDADHVRRKVDVLARAITAMGLGTEVLPLAANLISREVVMAVAECDIVFGCMDSVEGRHLLNRLAACYSQPYFDLGVKLKADGQGCVEEACGAVHYMRPDGASLLDRRVYSLDRLKSDGLKRTDPGAYSEQVKAGYIHGVLEDRPAVISINMQVASCAVNEFLARLHPYRFDANSGSSAVRLNFMDGTTSRDPEAESSGIFTKILGRGDVEPLLEMSELSKAEESA